MKLRRAAVHKAQPIKHYKPMEVSCLILLSLDYSRRNYYYLWAIFWGIIITADNYFSKVKPSTKPLTQPEPPQLQVSKYINNYLIREILITSPIFEEFTMFKPQAGKARANATFNQWKYHNMIIHTWRTIGTIVSHSEAQFNRVYCEQILLCLFLSELRWY